MKVYIPFEDGSAVSYDGKKFVIHKRPVGIDADLSDLSDGAAAVVWRERRGEMVKALEAVWWKEYERRKDSDTKKIYSNVKIMETE